VAPRRLATALAIVMVLTAITPTATFAAPSPTTRTIQSGLVVPWDLAFTTDGQMFVTERPGRVRVYASGKPGAPLLATSTISAVRAQGESGLMGIAVDPKFKRNRLIYVCVSRTASGQWLNQVMRFRVQSNWRLTFDRWIIRFGMRANTIHNGCAVEVGPDQNLWITMGDSANPALAQDPDELNGKILRVKRDGSIPADNPIWSGDTEPTAVYSIGHRNPQGIDFQPGTGRPYAIEHGPDRDDEINLIRAGRNYGWPCVTGPNLSFQPGTPGCGGPYTRPVWSSASPTLATSNATFTKNASKWDSWTGHLMVTTLKEQDIRRFSLAADGSPATLRGTHFNGLWGRLRGIVLGPGYQLYVTTSNGSNDRVVRITP
jgi:glucose/arabinose dehydrogenase